MLDHGSTSVDVGRATKSRAGIVSFSLFRSDDPFRKADQGMTYEEIPIPEDLKERIFFPMVSGRAQGSGLGLSITQTIISRHRGWIEVESEPGHTAIDVMLPLGDMP